MVPKFSWNNVFQGWIFTWVDACQYPFHEPSNWLCNSKRLIKCYHLFLYTSDIWKVFFSWNRIQIWIKTYKSRTWIGNLFYWTRDSKQCDSMSPKSWTPSGCDQNVFKDRPFIFGGESTVFANFVNKLMNHWSLRLPPLVALNLIPKAVENCTFVTSCKAYVR